MSDVHLECLCCGLELPGTTDPKRLYDDGEELKCEDCGARSVISIDEDDGAYLSYYVCVHDKRDDEPCDLCESDLGDGVSRLE